MQVAVPDIEENIPLPASAANAMPDLTPSEELAMRARTIQMLSEMTGRTLTPTSDQTDQAIELAKIMMGDPVYRPDFSRYSDETMAVLAGLVARSNKRIVEELSDLKMFVVNQLVYEATHTKDAKIRMTALTKLGEIDGVDAFKKRSEMTVNIKPIAEVEKELLTILDNVEYRVLGSGVSERESASNEQEGSSPDADDADSELSERESASN